MTKLVADLLELSSQQALILHLQTGALVASRLAPLVLFAPWLALRDFPVLVRSAIVLVLSAALVPFAVHYAEPPAHSWMLGWLSLREVLLGTVFAVVTALPLYALGWAGRFVDTWRGASLSEVLSPGLEGRSSPLGMLYLMMGIALFTTMGGHRLALRAAAHTFESVPVGRVSLGPSALQLLYSVVELVGAALAMALAVAGPAAACIVLTEVALGLTARVAPQVPVFFAGMPLRAAGGIIGMALALWVMVGQLPGWLQQGLSWAGRLAPAFSGAP